jgi:dipeptidyl-peptidase 4
LSFPTRYNSSMKRIALFILLATISAHAQKPAPKPWTVEDIFKDGGPTGTPPHNIEWSPDGKLLTFLATDDTAGSSLPGKPGDLLALDTATNKISVLATAEKLTSATPISEKDKDHRARYGMPSYTWAADSKHLILDSAGVISLYDVTTQTATRIVDTHNGSGDDPKFSPDAKSISYLRDHNLFVADVKNGREQNLTRTNSDSLLNGEVDWVYLEELEVRSNYFWSPDSQRIAYLQADESKVPEYPLTGLNGTHATIDMQRYPQPGDPNPSVRIGIVSANGSKTKWLDIPQSAGNDYIPRFGWVTAQTLYVELLTRDQKHLNIYLADASSGKTHLILDDYDSKYLDTNYDVTFIDDSRFIIKSWRGGHTHLYLYTVDAKHPLDATATLTQQLTSGNYEADQLLSVDLKNQTVFYTSNEGNPLENALYSVHLDGTNKTALIPIELLHAITPSARAAAGVATRAATLGTLIDNKLVEDLPVDHRNVVAMPSLIPTSTPGTHYVQLSPDYKSFIDMGSSTLNPYTLALCNIASAACTSIWSSKSLDSLGYTPIPPETFAIKLKDGTTLYATLTLPHSDPPRPLHGTPLIVNPYGGPHEQSVTDSWGGANELFDQLLAQHGFAVLHIDNRGMGGRGRDFEQAAYGNFGPIQLEDQLNAIDQVLAFHTRLDPARVGIWGWSWGGSFTLFAMEHSDRFKTGVAVAPVTDWRLYDSIYTERYLGLPADNSKIYDIDSTIKSSAQLKGKLLLIHGTGDDNVHLANSMQQQQAFIDAQIPFDLELFPGKTHSIAGYIARVNLFNHILQYFEMNLKQP